MQKTWARRALPVTCGCAAAGLAAFVALNDPSATNSHFPQCVFRATTGLWCPGCGLTRGFHQLFNGDVGSALSYNLFVPLVVLAAGLGWWSWMRTSWDRPPLNLPQWLTRPIVWALPAALIVYGVLRNIPTAPFNALAP
ncbi:MAG: DUF2752 domain-containing protein [Ilumatobacteraceae bacterium]